MRHNPFAAPLTRHRRYTNAPRTWIPGEMVTSNMMNSIRDLFVEIENGTAYMKKSTMVGQPTSSLAGMLSAIGHAAIAYDVNKNDIVVSKSGGPFLTVGTKGIHEFPIPSSFFRPWPNAPCGWHEDTIMGSSIISGMPFDPVNAEHAYCWVTMPKHWDKGAITAQLYSYNKVGGGQDTYWAVGARAVHLGESLDGALVYAASCITPNAATTTASASAISAPFTPTHSPADGDLLEIRVVRDPNADNFASDTYFHALKIRYTSNADHDG